VLDPFGVTAVRFFARNVDDGQRFLIGQAVWSNVWWLAGWDARRLPNGTYLVQAVVSAIEQNGSRSHYAATRCSGLISR
jgi:hypothetical protein